MRKSSVVKAALAGCLAALAVCAWLMFGQSSGISYANADKYTAGDTRITAPVEELDLNWTSGLVRISYHAGDGIEITETSSSAIPEDRKLQWWLDGKVLRVQYEKSGLHLSFGLTKILTVSLPEGTRLKAAGIHATAADMDIPALSAEEIVLENTSGNITATAEAKKLTVRSSSGDPRICLTGDAEAVSVDSTSGSITLATEGAGSIRAHSTSGNITLTVNGAVKTLDAGSTSGVITAGFASADSAKLSCTSGGISVRAEAFGEMDISLTSGSITAVLPESPGFTCTAEMTSGNFESGIALSKNGREYTCGDGSGKCRIRTTSGNVRIEPLK